LTLISCEIVVSHTFVETYVVTLQRYSLLSLCSFQRTGTDEKNRLTPVPDRLKSEFPKAVIHRFP
jgi:hypothetical protein